MLSLVAIAFATFGVAILARGAERSWIGPATLFALMWAAYLLTAILFITDAESIRAGMIWIWFSSCAIYLGAAAGEPFVARAGSLPRELSDRALPALRTICMAALVVGIADGVIMILARGFPLSGVLEFAVVAQVAAQNRAEAYGGEADTSVLQRLVWVALFVGCAYGGILFRVGSRRRDKLMGLGAFLVVAALYSLFGSRMGVLYGGAIWAAAWMATHAAVSDPGQKLKMGFMLRLAAVLVIAIIGLSTLSQALRYFTTQTHLDWFRMIADPFSFVAAFGIWFGHAGMQFGDLLYGGRIFRRLYEFIGIRHELPPAIEVGFTTSNIYTVFRDLIEDFNPVGSTIVLALFGFAGRITFALTRAGRLQALPWLVLCYAFAITSFASGLLSYTTTAAAIALFIVTFRFLPPIAR